MGLIAVMTVLVIVLPGLVVGALSGLRPVWSLAVAAPISFSIYGLAGWLYGVVGIPFNALTALLATCVLAGLAFGWRVLTRPGAWAVDRREAIRAILPGAGVVVGAGLAMGLPMYWQAQLPRGLETVVQGWDSHWHASVVRFISEEGMASPTRMGELLNIESEASNYYPVAYHAAAALVTQLAPASPIAAINMMAIIAPAITLPISLGLVAWKMVGNRSTTASIAAGLAAASAMMIPTVIWIGNYVGAWPYVAGVTASAAVAILFATLPHQPAWAFAAALALAGITQLHPSAVTTVVLIAGFYWLTHLLIRPARSRLKDLGVIALTGLTGALVILPQLLFGSGQAEEVIDWTTSDGAVTREEAWLEALTMDTRHVSQFFPGNDMTLVLVLAAIGGITALVWYRNLWAPLFYGFSLWLTAHALKPYDLGVLDLIAGLHYSTAHRLIMPVAIMTFAAAAVGLAVLIRLLSGAPFEGRWPHLLAGGLAVAVGAGVALYGLHVSGPGARASYLAPREDDRMVNAADLRAWDWLARQPHAYEGLIGGDPAEGYGWMYPYNGLPSLHRHYQWPTSMRESATTRLYSDTDLLGEGTAGGGDGEKNFVDCAADELNMHYFVLSPGPFWAQQLVNYQLWYGLFNAEGATPVYRDGDVIIFAVNDKFDDDELKRMRSESPDPLPERKVSDIG
ncbi:DUF6541 family protein [Corynebacterium yudongzhengii]|nr:DUF6541 family protein [Corynebacterium yudongzhengii]